MDDRLYKFSRLAEVGTYTKAAKELHISQPALSVAIQKLERELGHELFIKTGKRLELTAAGQATYQAALEHQDVTSHLVDSLHRLARKRPTITIGMVDSVADVMCSTPAFDELEATANVTVIVNNSRYLREGVERRKIDLAIVIDDELDHQGLTSTLIGTEQLQLVFAPQLDAEMQQELEKKHLHNFISYDKPSTTYRHIQQAFAELDIKVSARLFSTSPSVMLGIVLRGKGCAVLPQHLVAQHIEGKQLRSVLTPVTRPIAVVTTSTKIMPEFVTEFLVATRYVLRENC